MRVFNVLLTTQDEKSLPSFEWGVKQDNNVYYLQSLNDEIQQKIKIGKTIPDDLKEINVNDISFNYDNGICIQDFDLPSLNSIKVDGRNMNPKFFEKADDESEKQLLIVTIDTRYYNYLRSYVSAFCGEMISTFSSQNYIGCFILVDYSVAQKLVFSADVGEGESYKHCRITIDDNNKFNVSFTNIKKADTIEELVNIKKRISEMNIKNRFSISSKFLLTPIVVVPSSTKDSDVNTFVCTHKLSDNILNVQKPNNDKCVYVYPLDVDEEGYIIENDKYESVKKEFHKRNIRAVTFLDCRLRNKIINDLKLLYVFRSKLDLEAHKYINCIKSN